jgi:putative phosphoribosyl transferase
MALVLPGWKAMAWSLRYQPTMGLSIHSEQVRVEADEVSLEGVLWLPEHQIGAVLFGSGNGGNRLKPPNDYVASVLRNAGLATLWLDLVTAQEARSYQARLDICLLARRLSAACDWLRQYGATSDLPIGLFGVSDGAAAALQLASERGGSISALVSRGGHPELVSHGAIGKISAPTLLIVGGLDDDVLDMNRTAYAALRCEKRLEIIPGGTHFFDEPGSLEVVARLARAWFVRHTDAARSV